MKNKSYRANKLLSGLLFLIVLTAVFALSTPAATLSENLRSKLAGLANNASVGMVIVSFKTTNGLQASHLNILRGVGILGGQTFPKLGMVAQPMTAGQVRALQNNPNIRSIWSNDRLQYFMNQARTLTGVDRLRVDAGFTARNGATPVSGAGDFSVLVIDSGIDGTHQDLSYGTKVIQNVHPVLAAGTLPGFTPNVTVENIPNTDESVGHGTHCAGIIGGTGARSGGAYTGVAPGAKLIGAGLGAGILVVNPLGAWEWALTNQFRYNIKVISNSYGPLGGGPFDPDNPITVASKLAYDRGINIVFAAGNDGAAKNTMSPYAKAPWVIGVAAGTKDGTLADFSSRGTPRSERLGDNDPLNDNDAPTITAPGTGRAFETSLDRFGFTAAIASVRSTSNLTANGLTDDAELPVGMIPFYTQISGTSMATPFVAGTIALMLDADPTLTPDEIKQIITATATRMPGYDDYEVGSGYINSYAAVDKVFNRSRTYRNFQDVSFNATFGEERPAAQNFHIDFSPEASGPASTNATTFTVEPNINVLDVFARADNMLEEGLGNLVGIRVTSPSGVNYSTAIEYPVLGSSARQITVDNPEAGTWTLEVRGARGLTAAPQASLPMQAALPGPVDGTVSQVRYILPDILDIEGHSLRPDIEFALKNRLMDTYENNKFYPDDLVSRGDLAGALMVNSSLRQSAGASPKFGDLSGDLSRIADSVTSNGPSLRDYDFAGSGMMGASGNTFSPLGQATRLDMAIALVKALGHDREARALANTDVTFEGAVISDNAQIPAAYRGYVQIAINNGLFEAFPAGVVEIAPGQFEVRPGPRFEPGSGVTRGVLAQKLKTYHQLFTTGG